MRKKEVTERLNLCTCSNQVYKHTPITSIDAYTMHFNEFLVNIYCNKIFTECYYKDIEISRKQYK